MAKRLNYKRYPTLDSPDEPMDDYYDFTRFSRGSAIEKINARINKDVRPATFGILQYMDEKQQQIGRLRAKAERENARNVYEAKKLISRGESGSYPGVPAMGQRDVRQMRKAKPGIVPRAESFA